MPWQNSKGKGTRHFPVDPLPMQDQEETGKENEKENDKDERLKVNKEKEDSKW